MPTAPHRSTPLLAVLVTVLLWASTFVGIRFVGAAYSPGALQLGRMVVGAATLTAFVGVRALRTGRPPRLPRGRVLAAVLAWGAGWFGLYVLAIDVAEQRLDAGTVALLVNLAPSIVAMLAGVLLKEGFPRRRIVGIGVAFSGVLLIGAHPRGGDVAGVLLAVTAAVLYAVGATAQKRLLARVDALTMTWLGAIAGVVVGLPFAPELLRAVHVAPLPATAGVAYIGLLPTAVAFVTWGYALSRTSAGRLASTTYAVPPLVILLSWAALSEVPTALALVGGAICLSGVAIATGAPSPSVEQALREPTDGAKHLV